MAVTSDDGVTETEPVADKLRVVSSLVDALTLVSEMVSVRIGIRVVVAVRVKETVEEASSELEVEGSTVNVPERESHFVVWYVAELHVTTGT